MDLVSRYEIVVEDFSNASIAIGKAANNFVVPLALWGIALLLAGYAVLPSYLSGLKVHGPYLVLFGGLMLSLVFRRGRAFFVLLSLTLAYFAFVFFFQRESGLVARAAYAAMCVFVPMNIAVFALLRERGALNAPGMRRLSLLLIEVGAIVAIVASDLPEFVDMLYRPIVAHASPASVSLPQWGIVFTCLAIVTGVVCSVLRGSVIDAAFAAAAAAFALACNSLPSPGAFAWFCTIAAVIVAFAVAQDSHRLAFYDELTGLPGRRALNERLQSLDGGFTLAMVDIDHFKAFNDAWGHDVGDQVLRLVAARLQRVGGGGTAYRYGGEEFVILFAGRRGSSVVAHLDTLRRSIDDYKITLRHAARRRNSMIGRSSAAARNRPNAETEAKWISITVSIGVAERESRADAPSAVFQAADKALYRAKAEGRNRVVSS
ncbi:MAG TPA: GGDEF domain-containing protein [Burkholderiales bacterium]|nr:GGDEF domain-containing protein [Burkholderiales bacterium]